MSIGKHKLLSTALWLFCSAASAQQAPSPETVMQNFGIAPSQLAQLEQGEIVSYDVDETSQKELASGVAMYLPVSISQLAGFFKNGDLVGLESDVLAYGAIADNADINTFKKFVYTERQLDEAKAFLAAEAGDEFNLSKAELETLHKLQASLDNADNKTLLKAASQQYRQFLLQRWQAYRNSGLNGIAAYDRDGNNADPAAELRTDTNHSQTWAHYFPALQKAWLNYPISLPEQATETFFWMNRLVENRPTPILNHRIILATEQGGMILSRQFYVGHSYNSSQVVAGGVPYKAGTIVFYSTRSSTDQVAGMGSSLKHSIGREQVKKSMISRLQLLNKKLKRPSAAVAAAK